MLRSAECYGEDFPNWKAEVIVDLRNFLPGRLQSRTLSLALECVLRVEAGTAETSYRHRGAGARNQSLGPERFEVPGARGRLVKGGQLPEYPNEMPWKLHVDCAGFQRNVYEAITESSISERHLSDRRFLRASDFARFFAGLPSVLERSDCASQWRRVPCVSDILPGDFVSYTPSDYVARKTLAGLLRDVRMQLDLAEGGDGPFKHALENDDSDDEGAEKWIKLVENKLEQVGVNSPESLLDKIEAGSLNEDLQAKGKKGFGKATMDEFEEACLACKNGYQNTGHIVMACEVAEKQGKDAWRVQILHSTGSGKHAGVQRGYHKLLSKKGEDGKVEWLHERTQCLANIGRLIL
mmetsp:Transcript_106859/g.344779  ORF Transcript_106859/g.344779 Transcript_106859/m.344779 type:complete len:352 (-) Transcript_106859:163-1218(-)